MKITVHNYLRGARATDRTQVIGRGKPTTFTATDCGHECDCDDCQKAYDRFVGDAIPLTLAKLKEIVDYHFAGYSDGSLIKMGVSSGQLQTIIRLYEAGYQLSSILAALQRS